MAHAPTTDSAETRHDVEALALKSRVLNLSVLVSLGILTSYLFSFGLTLFAPGQDTFYEAAVMLAAFLLFGHWMEMRARRGSSDSR